MQNISVIIASSSNTLDPFILIFFDLVISSVLFCALSYILDFSNRSVYVRSLLRFFLGIIIILLLPDIKLTNASFLYVYLYKKMKICKIIIITIFSIISSCKQILKYLSNFCKLLILLLLDAIIILITFLKFL